jgi:hypothetical protein
MVKSCRREREEGKLIRLSQASADLQASVALQSSIEALKAQRDLYVAFRDLFYRHDSECMFMPSRLADLCRAVA